MSSVPAHVTANDETNPGRCASIEDPPRSRGKRPDVATPGKNQQVSVFGAIEMTTGR